MDQLKKGRRPVRAKLTKALNESETLLQDPVKNKHQLRVKLTILQETYRALKEFDSKVEVAMMGDDTIADADVDKEFEEVTSYQEKFLDISAKIEDLFVVVPVVPLRPPSPTPSVSSNSTVGNVERRGMKLPQIQLGKFNGDLKEWLGFWSQFEKIHDDPELDGSEKFHYLSQYMVPGTTAHQIVSSYPMTSGNYPKAVEALKAEFGNKDMLLQVYVRELLKLVITNVNAKQKIPLESLVIQLESHLRSLETLKLENADPATWLFPLVESSLPEEILLTWQRSPLSNEDKQEDDEEDWDEPKKTRLDYLMEFLRKEVSIKKRIKLAQSGFQDDASRRTDKKKKDDKIPTLAGFHVGDKSACVFCDKAHPSQDCFIAMRMSHDQKKQILNDKSACYVCLRVGHSSKKCRAKVMCTSCGRRHYGILCDPSSGKERIQQQFLGMRPESAQVSKGADWTQTKTVKFEGEHSGIRDPKSILQKKTDDAQHFTDMSNHVCTAAVKLMTVLVDICVDGRKKTVRAFLDSGSQRSYIRYSTAEGLGLKPFGTETATHSGFTGMETPQMKHKKFNVTIGRHGGGFQCALNLRGITKICNPIPQIPRCKKLFQQLKENRIFVSDIESVYDSSIPEIEVLIGVDYYGRLHTGKVVQLNGGLTAFETRLGWVLSGEDNEEPQKISTEDSMGMLVLSMTVLEAPLEDMWKLETIGIMDDTTSKSAAVRELEAKEKFMRSITKNEEGRYEVRLPFIEDHPTLPSNKQVALRRLERESEKLVQKGKFNDYDVLLQGWNNEFTEVVPQNMNFMDSHYVPHRPVFKDSLTTPVRPVFDCSCKVKGNPSLNDCLEKGSNYILKIPELLLRFREKSIGITADIRKAFQMISVNPEDRKYLRFLWWENYQQKTLVEYQHSRVVFGATCSPFILGAVLEYHLSRIPPPHQEVAQKLLEGFYVDNYLNSEDTIEDYKEFREKATSIIADAKMELRMWMSNVDEFDDPATIVTSILGIRWHRKDDVLFVLTENILQPDVITKRAILSTVQKIFDPLGFVSPALVPAKLILQQLWEAGCKWDDEVITEKAKAFKKWFREIKYLQEIRIPRVATAGVTDKSKWTLHTFTDASAACFACATFLRVEGDDGVDVQLLMSKARIAPVKPMTTPRLETTGCLIGSRMATTVKEALKLDEIEEFYWTDSTTALAWIQRELNHDVFVRNRVKEIRSKTNRSDWRHVPGTMNPADLPSRGCSPLELLESKWWEGPDWLKMPRNSWPSGSAGENEEEIMAEVKKNVPVTTASFLDNARRDYTFPQTVRIMGWVIRAVYNFKNPSAKNLRIMLSGEEIKKAERAVWKEVQDEAFTDQDLHGWNCFRSRDGLIRKNTRIVFREDVADFKKPLLLPSKHHLVRKIIMDAHLKNCHAGVQFLMAQLRETFWILQSRTTIKRVISQCVRCRRYAAKPTVVEEAPLPEDRIKDAEPFEVTGVDLAGPLILKNQQKAWIVLYTCAVYRAVYLDVVTSLSSPAFTKSMGKFVDKHGRPAIMYSDNGSNFRGSSNQFKQMDWATITATEGVKPIQWRFNPPAAPWWGGWWERLIRTVKDLLRKTLGNSVVNTGELMMCLKRIEYVMNNRPLMHVTEDPNDLEPLTPAMFLRIPVERCFPEGELSDKDKLRVRHQHLQSLKDELKRRFRIEYLGQLVSTSKKTTRELQLGELVFIRDEQRKRLQWKFGRILEFLPGKDGVSRLARVKTIEKVMLIPLQRLHPLELDCQVPEAMKRRSGRKVKAPERLGTEKM